MEYRYWVHYWDSDRNRPFGLFIDLEQKIREDAGSTFNDASLSIDLAEMHIAGLLERIDDKTVKILDYRYIGETEDGKLTIAAN